jgi:CheY-like chemotaxis protein
MTTVLIIEDERLFLTLARDGLEKAGHAVRIAADSAAALEILAQEPVGAIVLDILMPETDGLALLAECRSRYPEIPVVVVGGRESPRSEAEAKRLGALGCLRKPLEIEELVRMVGGAIAGGGGGQREGAQLPQLARLQQSALELLNMIRWDSLGEFLKNNALFFQRVIDFIADVLEVEIVSLMLVAEREGTLRIAHAKGLDPAIQRRAVSVVGQGISGGVAETGKPLLIRDLSQDPVYGTGTLNPRYRTNSLMCVPLKVNGKTIGVLNANNKVTGEPFTEADLALFTTFSCLVSLSLATTQIFERLASSVEELARTNARLARANVELEARVRELQALRAEDNQ